MKKPIIKSSHLYLFNGIMAIGLIGLYVLYFIGHSGGKNKTPMPNDSVVNIAFVNSDSIVANYQLVLDLKNKLLLRTQELQEELNAQQQNFEHQLNVYQNKVKSNSISIPEAQKTEKNLGQKQQQLMQLEQQYSQELAQMEYDIQLQLMEKIIEFLKRYNEDKNWNYILGYSFGGGILYAGPDYDLTEDVLLKLNKEYENNDIMIQQ